MTKSTHCCRDCRHWKTHVEIASTFRMEKITFNMDHIGICDRVPYLGDCVVYVDSNGDRRLALRENVINLTLNVGKRGEKAGVTDADGFSAYLATMDDFGCVQFEKKQ